METRKFLSLIGSVVAAQCLSQSPAIEWQKCLGGSGTESAASVDQTSDGGYIVAGTAASTDGNVTGIHGSGDFWVVKLDAAGSLQWEKSLGGSSMEEASCIAQTIDGGYIVTGYTRSTNNDVTNNHGNYEDCWVVKLSADGNIQWEKCLGGSNDDNARAITQTSDSGYVTAGYAHSTDGDVTNNHGLDDFWVVKLDAIGNLQWEKCLGGSYNDNAYAIAQTVDGGFIVAGNTQSTDGDVTETHGQTDIWVVKMDAAGSLLWEKSIGGSSHDQAASIASTIDGGCIVTGITLSNDSSVTGNHGSVDFWVVKLDGTGNLQWQKCLGGSSHEFAKDISQASDGGYILCGYTHSIDGDISNNLGQNDCWLVKLSADGDLQWEKCLGGSNNDNAASVAQTTDGGFIMAGSTESTDVDVSNNNGGSDFWVVKLGPNDVGFGDRSSIKFTLSPNPAHGAVRVTRPQAGRNATLTLRDAMGREMLHVPMSGSSVDLELQTFPTGLYLFTGTDDKGFTSQRLVVE